MGRWHNFTVHFFKDDQCRNVTMYDKHYCAIITVVIGKIEDLDTKKHLDGAICATARETIHQSKDKFSE